MGIPQENIFLKNYNKFKETGGRFLKIVLQCDSVLSQSLPWELLYDSKRNQFLSAEENISIIRYPRNIGGIVPKAEFTDKIKFLIIHSTRDKEDLPRSYKELESIKQTVEDLDPREDFVICKVLSTSKGFDPPTRKNLETELEDANIVHFIGHSIFEDGKGKIFIPEESGDVKKRDDADFATWFPSAEIPNIGIVTLNSCRSGAEQGFRGLAKELLMRRIPCVVAMQFDIPDRYTPDFSKTFYESFLKNKEYNPEKAMIEARRSLLNDKSGINNPYYASAVIYTALGNISDNMVVFKQKQEKFDKLKQKLKTIGGGENRDKHKASEFIRVEVDSNRSINLYDELKSNLVEGQLDQKFLYWSYKALRRWYKVVNSGDYQMSNWGKVALQHNSSEIADIILERLNDDDIDLISLGSGIGDKDCQLINSFLNYRKEDMSLSYYPVDHSVFMIGESIRNAIQIRRSKFYDIFPILANFKYVNRLANVIKSPENPRVLTMLGGTLANYPENLILNSIHNFMREDDCLLIDAEFHLDQTDKDLIKGYDNEVGREFIVGPIEDIAEPYENDCTIKMRIGEFSITGDFNEIRKRVTYEVDDSASAIRTSRTIIGKLDTKEGLDITLFSATKYDKKKFEDFLERMNFKIVKQFYSHQEQIHTGANYQKEPYAIYALQIK